MPRAKREEQFTADEVCLVHVTHRCVRRAYLTGVDKVTGEDHSERREWIRRRAESLASVFAIDLLQYATMENHVHLIVRNRPDVVDQMTDEEVAIRWLKVYPGKRLDDCLAQASESEVQMLLQNPQKLARCRRNLSDISWFMRSLAEPIARRANREDECTGHFWEGRFGAKRILDEAGLLACAVYVDLNPIRAAMAETPAEAAYTSAYDRFHGEQGAEIESAAFDLVPVSNEQAGEEIRNTPVDQLQEKRREQRQNPTKRRVRRDGWLARLTLNKDVLGGQPEVHTDGLRASDKGFLNLEWQDYWQLVCWTAAQTIGKATVELPAHLTKCLAKIGVDLSQWSDLMQNFRQYFGGANCIGTSASMAADAQRVGRRWHRGQRAVAGLFTATSSPPLAAT